MFSAVISGFHIKETAISKQLCTVPHNILRNSILRFTVFPTSHLFMNTPPVPPRHSTSPNPISPLPNHSSIATNPIPINSHQPPSYQPLAPLLYSSSPNSSPSQYRTNLSPPNPHNSLVSTLASNLYKTPPLLSTSLNLDEELKLYTNSREREKYENMADLYSIIVCTEHLEKAYIRDSITSQEYTPLCSKLIAQYRAAMQVMNIDILDFMREYKVRAVCYNFS